jgi:GTP 3',8-cyclase
VFGRDHAFLPRQELLSVEEITRSARLLASLGVCKIRLTGGEPLVRRDIEHLVEMRVLWPECMPRGFGQSAGVDVGVGG